MSKGVYICSDRVKNKLVSASSSSRSISSSGRRCQDVSAKLMPVLRHSAAIVPNVCFFSHLCLGLSRLLLYSPLNHCG